MLMLPLVLTSKKNQSWSDADEIAPVTAVPVPTGPSDVPDVLLGSLSAVIAPPPPPATVTLMSSMANPSVVSG
jgi:hypothetical protein